MVWSKPHAVLSARYELEMQMRGLQQLDGPWYIVEHFVRDKQSRATVALGSTDWADWCQSGDLLFAKHGRLFRLGFSDTGVLNELDSARLLIDLTDRTFKEVAPPDDAKHW
jgi:hypothetical protein